MDYQQRLSADALGLLVTLLHASRRGVTYDRALEERTTMMTIPESATIASRGSTGALDALANYWIKKAMYDNLKETQALPECNLECSASESFGQFLFGQQLDASVAFETGLAVAAIIFANPLDAGDAIRELLTRTIEEAAEAGRPKRELGPQI